MKRFQAKISMGVGSNLFGGDGHRILLRGGNRFRVADSSQNRFLFFSLFNNTIKGVGVNCSNCDCSTAICSTLLAANQLLDTNFNNCWNPVNPG
jgi:hypothetical protein